MKFFAQFLSHDPFAFTAVRFLPSFTSTCKDPFVDVLRAVGDDLMLPNLRKFKLPPLLLPPPPILLLLLLDDDDDVCFADDVADSGGINFKPTMMSPRYVVTSSKGSLYVGVTKMVGNV